MPYRLVQFTGVPVWLGVVNVLGDVLWLVAYILIIRQGFKDRTYGVPMLCVALNFSWEFIYAVQFPFPNKIIETLRWTWLLTDAVIVYQFFQRQLGGCRCLHDQPCHEHSVCLFVFQAPRAAGDFRRRRLDKDVGNRCSFFRELLPDYRLGEVQFHGLSVPDHLRFRCDLHRAALPATGGCGWPSRRP